MQPPAPTDGAMMGLLLDRQREKGDNLRVHFRDEESRDVLASVLEVRIDVAALVSDDASENDMDKHNPGLRRSV